MVAHAARAASLLRPGWTAAPPGALGAPAWRTAAHEHFGQTDVYLLEDGTYLYVAYSAKSAAPDGEDAVKLYLWSDKAAYTFGVDAGGNRSAACSVSPRAAPHWSATERTQSGGYAVTMRLPRALFAGAGESRWLVQFARVLPRRHLAYTWPSSPGDPGNVLYATPFGSASAGAAAFAAAKTRLAAPKVAAAIGARRKSGTLWQQVQQLWPSHGSPVLAAPGIPDDAQGVAVAQTQDDVTVAGVDAKSADGGEQNAQSLDWTSPDKRTSAGVQRVADTNGSASDVTQALSLAYDNGENMRFSAGVAADRGTGVSDASQANFDYYDFSLYGKGSTLDMRWNSAGPQYNGFAEDAPAPGTAGYTLSFSRAFGNIFVDADANRYRDDLGNLSDANERAAISAEFNRAFTFDVSAAANAATQYGVLPYAQSSAGLQYAAGGRQARLSYREDHFQTGFIRNASLSGGFTIPALGMLQFEHRQTTLVGTLSGAVPQQSSSASLLHRLHGGFVSVGYQYAGGAANVTFSFQDRLPVGMLRATYYNPDTPFSPPNFSVKLVPL